MKTFFPISLISIFVIVLAGFNISIDQVEAKPIFPSLLDDFLHYKVYEKGILVAELTLEKKDGIWSYTMQKRDRQSFEWLDPVTAPESAVAGNPDFQLIQAITDLPSQLQELRDINWDKTVTWPDADHVYVRHRTMTEPVNNRSVSANYYALRDGEFPMDFVISQFGNKVIAGIDPFYDICMVLDGFEDFTTVKRWNDPLISPGEHGCRSLETQWMACRDGILLATKIYLPDDDTEGPFPVLLKRTPYGISSGIQNYWPWICRGYAVVLQACRGSIWWDPENWSEGNWMWVNETRDGADCLEWIADQPWCNGNIGMFGGSYQAHTQWTAAKSGNPVLKCIIPEVLLGSSFGDMPYRGGTCVSSSLFYFFMMSNSLDNMQHSWDEIFQYRPLIDSDLFATGYENPVWNDMMSHWVYDWFWEQDDWHNTDLDIPAFHISGWYDDDRAGTQDTWAHMKGKPYQRLLMGSWRHNYNNQRKLNGFSFGIDAIRDDVWLLKQKWYDRFLKGIPNDVTDTVVDYYIMGDNKWVPGDRWPPAEITELNYYFHSTGNANVSMTNGILTLKPNMPNNTPDIYRYDPNDPPTNWLDFDQMVSFEDALSWPWDFNIIDQRDDICVYSSSPMRQDLTIAGDVKAILYASCDVLDTDWWVRLADVAPDGSSMRLLEYPLRARFRNLEDPDYHVFGSNFETEELLSGDPGDIVRYEIRMLDLAHTFKAGHRIRVSVMNASEHYCYPNSNTGENEAYTTRKVVGTMAIHHGIHCFSRIILPVIDGGEVR